MREAVTYSLPPFSNGIVKTLQDLTKCFCFAPSDKLLLSIDFIVFMYTSFNSSFVDALATFQHPSLSLSVENSSSNGTRLIAKGRLDF